MIGWVGKMLWSCYVASPSRLSWAAGSMCCWQAFSCKSTDFETFFVVSSRHRHDLFPQRLQANVVGRSTLSNRDGVHWWLLCLCGTFVVFFKVPGVLDEKNTTKLHNNICFPKVFLSVCVAYEYWQAIRHGRECSSIFCRLWCALTLKKNIIQNRSRFDRKRQRNLWPSAICSKTRAGRPVSRSSSWRDWSLAPCSGCGTSSDFR